MRIPDRSTEPYPETNGEQTRHTRALEVLFALHTCSVTFISQNDNIMVLTSHVLNLQVNFTGRAHIEMHLPL